MLYKNKRLLIHDKAVIIERNFTVKTICDATAKKTIKLVAPIRKFMVLALITIRVTS